MTAEPAILPMAIVMIAGPQIISAIFLATSEHARRASISYVLGVAGAVTVGVTIAYYAFRAAGAGTNDPTTSSGNHTVDLIIIGLLLVLFVYVYLNRKNMKPPKWMGKLEGASPRFAL